MSCNKLLEAWTGDRRAGSADGRGNLRLGATSAGRSSLGQWSHRILPRQGLFELFKESANFLWKWRRLWRLPTSKCLAIGSSKMNSRWRWRAKCRNSACGTWPSRNWVSTPPRERDSTLNKLAFDALHHLSTADCAFVSGLWELVGYSHRKYIFKSFKVM